MTRPWMGDHGQTLFDHGYRIVPIVPNDKAAIEPGWTRFGHQQTQADIDRFVRERPHWGIGIVTAWTPAIDIDVRVREVADALERLAEEMLGTAPRRIGMAPKRLLVFRTDAPLRKIATTEFVMPGDDPDTPGYKGHRVEVLGDGQQFVAFGDHPVTGCPYYWTSASPLDMPREDLPLLTEEWARNFLEDAQEIMTAAGGIIRGMGKGDGDRKAGSRKRTGKPKNEGGDKQQQAEGVGQGRKPQRYDRADLELIRDALRHIPNHSLPYDTWIRIGMALKAALGEAGKELFAEWSAQYPGNEPEIVLGKWDSFRPTDVGAGTIFWLARQNGWEWPAADHAGACRYEGVEPFYPDHAVPVDEAEDRTQQAIGDFLQKALACPTLPVSPFTGEPPPPPAAALRIGVGIGKTEAVLDGLAKPEWVNKSVYVCVPEHALADEIDKRFTEKSVPQGGPRGEVFRGRSQTHPSGDPMCEKADLAEKVVRMQGSVRHSLCERKVAGDKKVEYCEHHPARGGRCRYMEQVLDDRPAVRFMPNNYLFLPKPEGIPKPDVVIVDEAFWQTSLWGTGGPEKSRPFIRPDQLRGTRYVPAQVGMGDDLDATEELSKLSQRAADLLEAGAVSPRAFLEAGFTAADAHRARGLEYRRREALDISISPAMSAAAQRELLQGQQAREVSRLGRFWTILGRELDNAPDRDVFHGIVAGTKATDAGTVTGFFLRWSSDLKKHVRDVPVLVLDATANATILRRFLPNLAEPVVIEAQWPHVEVVQVTDTVAAKSSLVPTSGASADELQRRGNRREDLRRLVEVEVAWAGGPRKDGTPAVLAVTYKGAVRNGDGTNLIQPVSGAEFAWLNGVRGKDRWRNVTTLIVTGRTQPSAGDIEAMTSALFFDDPMPIQTIGGDRYDRQVRGYRMGDGTQWGADADCLPDPRAEAVRWQVCEAELVQAIGRGRPARRSADRPLKILVRTSVPLPMTVTRLTTTREMAPTIVEVLAARGAVPVKPWADLAEAYPDLFETPDAARMAIARLIPNKPLYEILIGECSELRETAYRRLRPGQRATTGMLLYDPARVADPAIWLTEHLPGAEVIEPRAGPMPVPRTLADLHARLAGLNFTGFTAHDVRTGTGKPPRRRHALVTRCGTAATPMLTPDRLVPAAVEATPFDDLSVPEFRIRGQPVRPGARVVALDIPFDDPVPMPPPARATPLRLVRPEPLSDAGAACPACNEYAV